MARRLAKRAEQAARLTVDADGLAEFLQTVGKIVPSRDIVIPLCIGTDRSTGDAFGPLLGTRLVAYGWQHVVGTMDDPCDANRLSAAVSSIPEGSIVLAFDACLGKEEDIGKFSVLAGPLQPAAATSQGASRHAPIGHFSVAAIVGRKSIKPLWELQSASLRMVMQMANAAADAMQAAWERKRTVDEAYDATKIERMESNGNRNDRQS